MGNAQRVDRGRAVAAELAAAERAPSAFLAGSNVVGLGSASSDIDVYLIGPGWVERRRQLHAGGTRVDVQTLASERLDALVDQVLGADSLPERDLVLAVRLLTGDVVVDDGALAGLRKRLAGRPLSLRRLVIGGWAATAYSAVEDVAGLRDSADQIDRDAAVLAGRRALLAAGKAIAASGGDLYYGDKWVGHQVARTVPAAFPFDRYRRLSLHGAFDALPEIVALVQSCLAAALTVGWWGVSLEHWPDWPGGGGALPRAGERATRLGPVRQYVDRPGHRPRGGPRAAGRAVAAAGSAAGPQRRAGVGRRGLDRGSRR